MYVTPNFQENNSMSDFDIVMSIIQSRQSAMFGELYNRYYAKVYAKALSFVKNQSDAEDITQDVFSKAFLNLSKFQCRAKFSTWLYKITFNETMDFFRRRKNSDYSLYEMEHTRVDIGEESLLEKQDKDQMLTQLLDVLNELSGMEKNLTTMKYLNNYSIREIMLVYNTNPYLKCVLRESANGTTDIIASAFSPMR